MAKNKVQKVEKQVKETITYKKDGKEKQITPEQLEEEMNQVKFARSDLKETNKFIAKCKKEIAFCTIKPVKTSKEGELENQILFRNKKVAQICFSKVAYFSLYQFGAIGKTIVKPTNQSEIDEAYDWIISRIQSIEDSLNNKERKKPVTKKPKKAKSSKVESVEDLEKRIENMSADTKGIHISNPTDEILSWAESSNYKFVDGNTLLVKTE